MGRYRPTLYDECGNEIKLGDRVKVTCIDTSRGAQMWMDEAEVVGFGATRVKLQFPAYDGVCAVGNETMKVVKPIDGRELRGWSDVYREKEEN